MDRRKHFFDLLIVWLVLKPPFKKQNLHQIQFAIKRIGTTLNKVHTTKVTK